ncbi:DUF3347 domain-containing protein [Pedobacter sp. MC2016-14]|uniref:DUF3347 domain-containing protein n=1 Tax=Pedobacter sp. MC2016-14 TaxID=2897327 RepID=UPI001E43333A|nr:DUF3347 domain-containing protein [Pedobacter sp. MC2016-14]MCD0490152.1 DUF3347 domain-containing protein [Pedobacter sp. MC2016-14]
MNKYITAALLLGLLSCRNGGQKEKEQTETAVESTTKTPEAKFGDAKVQEIYADYIGLKNALVESSYEQAKEASKVLATKLNAYEGCENTALIASKIEKSASIEEQRKEFTFLSSDVIAMFKHADLKKGVLYVQHCPMANHGDGGDWLSATKNIQNPYYGDEMMECGAVQEEIKAN